MKKFSVLVSLALCVIIGGVYATWNYSTSQNFEPVSESYQLQLGNVVVDNTEGELSVNNTLSFTIEPTNDGMADGKFDSTQVDYTAKLVPSSEADLKISFTPTGDRDENIEKITVSYQVTVENNFTFEDKDAFSASGEGYLELTWNAGEGAYVGALTVEQLGIAVDATLDTYADYDAFNQLLTNNGTQFVLTVSAVESTNP